VDLQGKIEILREMINGAIPPEEYPLEFQGEGNMHLLIDKEVEVQTKGLPPAEAAEVEKSLREKVEAKTGIKTESRSVETQSELYKADDARLSAAEKQADETLAAVETAEVESVEEINDHSVSYFDLESLEIPEDKDLVQSLVKQNSDTARTLAAGAHEAPSKSEKQNFAEVSKEISERTQGGVEETGKSEPDKSTVPNEKPAADPTLIAGL